MSRTFFILLTGLMTLASPYAAAAPEPEAVEEIEEIEELDEVEPSMAQAPDSFWQTVGRMHPALVHLPIAWLLLLVLIDFGAWKTGKSSWESWGYLLLAATVLSFVPAMLAGFLRAGELNMQGGELEFLSSHRNLILLAFGLGLAALGLRALHRNRLKGGIRAAYLSLVTAAALAVMLAGHYGGKLVHGPAHLPF